MSNEIDALIRRGLQQEDRLLFDQLTGDMSVQDMALSAFHGRSRWLKIFAMVLSLVFFGLTIFCLWRFVQTEAVRSALNWALAASFCFLNVAMLKLYFWMEMHKMAVLREIKRVELQLCRLNDSELP